MGSKLSHDETFYVAGHRGMVGSAILRRLKSSPYIAHPSQLLIASRDELDLRNSLLVDQFFDFYRPSVVILAAAKVGGIIANSSNLSDFYLENIQIQNNVISSSLKYGVKRFIFLGSSCIYPINALQPISEDQLLSGRLESTNEAYALAKICGIKYCQYLRAEKNFDAISIMPCNIYGVNDNYHPKNSHVLAAMIRRFVSAKNERRKSVMCWGSGKPRREFLYVDDLASAVLHCYENWHPGSADMSWINVGASIDLTISDLASRVAKAVNYDGMINWDLSKPDGVYSKLMDSSAISSLGWSPKYSLDQGINFAIKDYLKS